MSRRNDGAGKTESRKRVCYYMVDVIILGAGTAGLSAAIYAVRAGLSVLVVEKNYHGGQIVNTPDVENYPGIPRISGFEFAENLHQQVKELGVEIVYEDVRGVDLRSAIKTVSTSGHEYQGRTVIIANGATHRHLGCPGEETYSGKGVSYCATCDGAFYRGMDVCVIGGGNTALEDALYLSNNCRKVYLIHRGREFRANRVTVEAVKARTNIEIIMESTVEEILGGELVEKVAVRNNTRYHRTELSVSGVFVAIGLEPKNQLFASALQLDGAGYIVAGEDCKTNIAGVFVAGDTRTKKVRQLVTAAADGAVAATEAAQFLM